MACNDALLREYVKNVGALDATTGSSETTTGLSPLLAKFFADSGGFNSYINKDDTAQHEVYICSFSRSLVLTCKSD